MNRVLILLACLNVTATAAEPEPKVGEKLAARR